jgi:hypothetical protein
MRDPRKFTQIGIFGLTIYHLTTLVERSFGCLSADTGGQSDQMSL